MLNVTQRIHEARAAASVHVEPTGVALSPPRAAASAQRGEPVLEPSAPLSPPRVASDCLVLPFESRQKSRLRTRLASGVEVGLFLERGTVLRGGDLLLADDGSVIEVVAANETVSTVTSTDASQLARAGYHLGNRHVAVQIGAGWLRYRHDHVLDDMVRGLGLPVTVEQAPFEPEGGAYSHSHSHKLISPLIHAHD